MDTNSSGPVSGDQASGTMGIGGKQQDLPVEGPRVQKRSKGRESITAPQSAEYDITGPDRQPGRTDKQSRLGRQPRKTQQGMYTQDNEEEGPIV